MSLSENECLDFIIVFFDGHHVGEVRMLVAVCLL